MATWQFDLELIPRRHVLEVVDTVDWWSGATLPGDYENRISAFLPWHLPWDPEWQVFGEEDGDRIDVVFENGHVQHVRARLDARKLDLELLRRVAEFATDCECVFVTRQGRVVEPQVDALLGELQRSPASTFVRDPQAFLEGSKRRRE
jgi:hypothetical protein